METRSHGARFASCDGLMPPTCRPPLTCAANLTTLAILVDGLPPAIPSPSLFIGGEDVLIRWPIGEYSAGVHTVQITHNGASGTDFYFDFLEAAVPSTSLPSFDDKPVMTAAT